MDVTCDRCSTAYEFDDALVSERGTTVKCTNCGHQFKVRRPQPVGSPERWLVRTIDGRELEFRALRELQAAIGQTLITRDDVLSRGGSRPRRLGSIAELEPFFAQAAGAVVHPTNLGLGPKPVPARARPQAPPPPVSRPELSVAIPLRDAGSVDEETHIMHGGGRLPSTPPPPPRRSTPPPLGATPLPGVVVAAAGAPPPPLGLSEDAATMGASYDQATALANYGQATLASARPAEPSVPPQRARPRPPLRGDATSAAAYGELTRAAPSESHAVADSMREPTTIPSPNRAKPRDEVSAPTAPFVISKVVDVTQDDVAAVPRNDWTQPPPPAEPSPAKTTPEPARVSEPAEPSANIATPTPGVRVSYMPDEAYAEPRFSQVGVPRRAGAARWIVGLFVAGMVVLAFATVGRKLLVTTPTQITGDARVGQLLTDGERSLGDGDLEFAKEQFDKASVLAERDPRVGADLARLAVTKADVDWLRTRLLAGDDPEQSAARRELDQAVQRARRAADKAAELSPTDAAVTRSRIDALRLAGDLESARKLVAQLSGQSSQPENALVLAELDLAESKPDWSTVIGRLRTAVGGEGNLGRARGLLVYALARSSDLPGAKAELERLKALPRPHPLLGALTAYLARVDKAVDPSALPDARPRPGVTPSAAPSPAPSTQPVRERTMQDPRPSTPSPTPEPPLPTGPIDTSDLPGVKAPATPAPPPPAQPTAAPPPPPLPPGIDTSDLPGFK